MATFVLHYFLRTCIYIRIINNIDCNCAFVSIGSTATIDLPTSSMDDNLSLNYSELFSQSKSVGAAYASLTSKLSIVLKKDNLPSLKIALISRFNAPGVKVGGTLREAIVLAKTSDDLVLTLQQSSSCNWLDTSLLEALACGSSQPAACELIQLKSLLVLYSDIVVILKMLF